MDKTKKYTKNHGINILWTPSKCTHAGICVKSLPKVYHPKEKPWIQPEEATVEELIHQIKQCPTGALDYEFTFGKDDLKQNYDTLSEAINDLRSYGYVEDFNLKQECLECRDGQFKIFHDQFEIDKVYWFDDMSDPADEAILYVVSSNTHKLKGVLVNGYGISTDGVTDEMLEKLKFRGQKNR